VTDNARRGDRPSERHPRESEESRRARLGPIEVIELAPTAARLGALAGLRATRWATSSTVAAGLRVARAVRDGEPPGELLASAREEAIRAARQALGIADLERRLARLAPLDEEASSNGPVEADLLQERGRQLVGRSAKLGSEPDAHPAFALLLEQLAPDEARILRVLARDGAQPLIDVLETGPLGVGSGRELEQRITVLADVAGCRRPELLQLYLDNLIRLGLVRVGDDPLDEEPLYDLLEAQPELTEAREQTSGGARAKVVRRRIELSELGRRFCELCLPVD
jgi:hypothetical protein